MKLKNHIYITAGKIAFIAVCVILLSLPMTPVRAENAESGNISGSSSDVLISVEAEYNENYRYACDIVFFNMIFRYNLQSVAHNSATDETYVNNGWWLLEENYLDGIPFRVINNSDTPLEVTVDVNSEDFADCNITVEKSESMQNSFIPACRIGENDVEISESFVEFNLKGFPDLYNYKGDKALNVVVYLTPASGISTSGKYFEYNR